MVWKVSKKVKKFITQIGFGVDQHGHDNDCTKAAVKAIKNAIANNCLSGLSEICNLKNPADMIVHVKIACPFPDKLNEKKVLRALPFGSKSLEVVKGGMIAPGIKIQELGDTSADIIVCNAAVSVSIKM